LHRSSPKQFISPRIPAYELAGIGLACLLVLIFPLVTMPVDFAAVLLVMLLVARRAQQDCHVSVKC
jgi:hypothetical protein